MAFKMKGFPFAGKSPIKDIQGDGTPEGTNHHHNNKHYDGMKHDKDGKWIEEAKPPPNKQKEEKKEVSMDEVYKALDKSGRLQDAGGLSAKELAAMSDEERAGNINDYTPGSFDKMVKEMKEKLSN